MDPDMTAQTIAVLTGLIAMMTSIAVGLFAAIRIAVAPLRMQLEAIEATQTREATRLVRLEDKVDRLVEQGTH